jgi:hypothetical protein
LPAFTAAANAIRDKAVLVTGDREFGKFGSFLEIDWK